MNRLRDTDANYDEYYVGLQLRSSWPFRSTQLFVCSALDAREAVFLTVPSGGDGILPAAFINELFKSSVIESFGSGFERTFSACREADVKYDYENTMTGFKFTFYRHQGHENVQDMSLTEKAVYDLLKEKDYLTIKQLAEMIAKSEKNCLKSNQRAKRKGLYRQGRKRQ